MANAQTIQLNLKAIGDFSDVTGDISQIQQMLNKIKVPQSLKNSFDGIFDDLTKETTRYQRMLDSGFKKKGDVTGLESSGERINNLLQRLKGEMGKIDGAALERSFQIDPSKIQDLQNKVATLRTDLQSLMSSDPMAQLKQSASNAAAEISKISKTKFTTDFAEAFNKGDIDAAAQALQNLQTNHKKFNDESKETAFQEQIKAMKAALDQLSSNPALQDIISKIRQTDKSIDDLDTQELERFIQAFQQGKTSVDGFTQGVRTFTSETNRAASAQSTFSTEVDQLKSQVQYFFGMTNAVYLLRNALQSAFQTVKELDAVMTETAVVTDFTIGDMWEKLPEYTEEASKLGASVKDLYAATTLYYQQGLKTEAAMGVGIETMKMARIANMDAADATQAMTAALRGFGMAVNETNALRVNDVYSELAAITAADTEQIATAMSKTASIAAAANMEFETTAALLAQIIETTQEAPETAGTALKTIIARFSEVKELQNKGEKTGEDEEGEVIDVNKIDKAMKSVGISMEGFFNGTEGLDSILMKLAEKWDTLDFTTQRYVATMAAGSRQQSRFIAMMSDYGRTTELVGAANTSAGASQEQFNKTLESMEAKLAQLKNAWDEFTMGIADNGLLKAGIDLLTGLLNLINDITGALPGPAGGIAKIGILLLGLRAGGKIFDAFFINLKACGAPAKALGKSITGLGVKIRSAFSKKNFTFDKDLYKAKAALSSYTREQEKANLAKTQSAAITKTDTASLKEKATWDGIAANSTTNMELAERRYAAALGLTTAQAQTAMALEQLGISTDMAAALAVEGITATELRELAVKKLGTGATEADILATMKEIAVEKVGDQVKKKSLTTRIAETAQTLLNTLAKWGLIPANTAAAFSEKVLGDEAMATGVKMLISLGIIGLIIAAVMLLIAGIVALVKHMQNSTPEAKMKALEEKAEKAAEAAEEAKTEFENLLSVIEEYKNIQENIEGLEKGTLEWAQAIKEANEQVLELIKNYPVLANYMSMGETGALQISQEGFNYLQNAQMEQLAISNGIAAFAELDIMKANTDNLKTNFKDKAKEDTGHFNIEYDSNSSAYKSSLELAGTNIQEVTDNILEKYIKGDLSALWSQEVRTTVTNEDFSQYRATSSTANGKPTGQILSLTDEGKARAKELGYSEKEFMEAYNAGEEIYQYSPEVIQLAEELGVTAIELYALRDSIAAQGSQYQVLIAQQKAYSKALVASTLSQNVLNSSYGAGITKSLGEVLTPERIEEIRTRNETEWAAGTNWNNSDGTTNENMKQKIADFNADNPESYITVTGDERDDMAAYYKALTGKETEHTGKTQDDEIAADIAEAEAALEINDAGDQLYNLAVSNVKAGQLMTGNLDTEYTGDAAATFGLDASNVNDKIIIDALDEAYSEIQTKREEINAELSNVFGAEVTATDKFGSYKQASKFLDEYNVLMATAGETAGSLFAQTFQAYAIDEDTTNALMDEFSGIDWSSSIEGAAALKDMLENGSIAAKDFATSMVLLAPAAYSATAQFNELYSLIGEDTLADLAKDGEITASEITALSKECKEVATVLDTTGISASTLGTYFELLEEGIISAADASDIFLQSLEQLNAASNTISETFSFMDNFEASRSQTEIGKYFSDMQTEIVELYNMGAYGDQRLIDYVKEFVGEENWGALVAEKGGDVKKALDEVMPLIESYGANMYGLWQQFAQMENGGMVSMGEGGAINFDLSQIGSVEQLKQQLMSQLNISEVVADAMIADAQTFSSGLSEGLDSLSLQDALGTWLSGALEVNGKKIISQSQLEAFAKEAGLDPKELEKAIGEADIGIEIKPYLDETGNLQEDIYEMVISQLEDTGNLSSTYALLLELGMDETMAKQTLTQMTTQLQSAGKNIPFTVNGQQLQATGKTVDEVMEYSTKDGTSTGTLGGIIDGLTDPAVAAQQQIAALQQGQMQAEATAVGGIAATGAVIGSAASGLDGMINSVVDWANTNFGWVGVSLNKSNLAGKAAGWTSGLMDTASSTVNNHFAGKIQNAQTQLNLANTNRTDTTDEDIQAILDNYEGKNTDDDSTESAYTDEDSRDDDQETGGGGSGEPWENPYDYFYSLSREINETLREREKIERRYDKLLKKRKVTAKELTQNALDELQTLQKELALQKSLKLGRLQQITEFEKQNASMKKYAQVTTNEYGQLALRIDWDAINRVKDSDKGEKIEEYISQMEEWFDSLDEIEEAIWDIEDATDEIRDRGKDQYFDLESKIKEALTDAREKEIEALSDISDSIEDTNSKILEAMQTALDKYRQERDNEETEKELTDKQRKLAYLQQDTSGANALEILELQKELDEETQDYTDELIDQKITELEEQNDRAAEQRERQIEIMEAQLENWINSGAIWEEVYDLMQSGLNEQDGLVRGSKLEALLKDADTFSGLSNLEKMKWLDDINLSIAEALSYLKVGRQLEGLQMEGEQITFTNAEGQTKSGKVDAQGNITTSDGELYTEVYQGAEGSYYTTESQADAKKKYEDAQKPEEEPEEEEPELPKTTNPFGKPSAYNKNVSYGMRGDKVKAIQHALNEMGYRAGVIDGIFGSNTRKAVMAFQKDAKTNGWNPDIGSPDGIVGPKTRKAFAFKQYMSGGLADFTGPAWLDGTKSRPEYILSADQTKAFFTLVDVLSSLNSKDSQTSQNTGDTNYDIDINVESIGNDYDVEQLASKVKSLINEDARYRNNNAINLMR